MTTPTWAQDAPPFAIDVISDDMIAEFAALGIPAKVLVGTWERWKADTSPRVILGLGGANGQSIQGRRFGPGPSFPLPNGKVARPLWSAVTTFNVWIAYPPQEATAPALRAREARALCWALFQSALAAMWHSHGGQFPWSNMRPLNEEDAMSTHGAGLTFTAQIDLPVLDLPFTHATGDAAAGETTLVREEGEDVIDAPPFVDDGT